MTSKNNHGGARAGAGRKPSAVPLTAITVRCTESERELIITMADEEGKNISRFVIDRIFGKQKEK